MSLLLDTHVVLWWLGDDPRLGSSTRRQISAARRILVSAITPWEIEIERATGRLTLPDEYLDAIEESGMELLPIYPAHAVGAGRLPTHHRDPFDRMLVAQARAERAGLVSADGQFAPYDVELVDATR